MKKSRTRRPRTAVESPTTRRLPLVELLVDTEAELVELAVRSGLQVLETVLEEDRTAICGPRDAHQADRTASRAGTVASEVVRGGRPGRGAPPARAGRGPGGPAADVSGNGPDRPAPAPHRRAVAARREYPPLCAES